MVPVDPKKQPASADSEPAREEKLYPVGFDWRRLIAGAFVIGGLGVLVLGLYAVGESRAVGLSNIGSLLLAAIVCGVSVYRWLLKRLAPARERQVRPQPVDVDEPRPHDQDVPRRPPSSLRRRGMSALRILVALLLVVTTGFTIATLLKQGSNDPDRPCTAADLIVTVHAGPEMGMHIGEPGLITYRATNRSKSVCVNTFSRTTVNLALTDEAGTTVWSAGSCVAPYSARVVPLAPQGWDALSIPIYQNDCGGPSSPGLYDVHVSVAGTPSQPQKVRILP